MQKQFKHNRRFVFIGAIKNLFHVFAFILLAGISAGCSLSFAADVTPPASFFTPTPGEKPVSTAVSTYPILLPDLQNGKNIYLDKCASCHGEDGLGNGPQANQLPISVMAFGNPQVARLKKPVAWFKVVTDGNLDRNMPDFKTSLSDRQRWDVVAYLYTLGYSTESLAEGERVYRQECELCHGSGAGDGSVAVEMSLEQPNWLDPAHLVQYSAEQLNNVIASGSEAGMPAFSERLTQEQMHALTGYIQTYSFIKLERKEKLAGSPVPESDISDRSMQTQVPAKAGSLEGGAVEDAMTIYGNVANGSGGVRPAGGMVTLQGFNGMDQAFSLTTELQANGSYRFDDVELVTSPILLTSVEYAGMTFFSEFLPLADAKSGDEVELPILVYDSTQDLTDLTADRVHIFFNFPQKDILQVVELFIIANNGRLVVTPEDAGQPVVQFVLPEGAENLQFEDGTLGGRFVKTEDGFGDTAAILPGNTPHQILFAFDIPYTRKKELSLQFPMDVQAVLLALPAGKVKLESTQLTDSGQRNIDGTEVQLFQAKNVSKEKPLELTLSGKPEGAADPTTNSNTNIAIGIAALGVSMILAGVWYARTRPKVSLDEDKGGTAGQDSDAAAPVSVESILDEIVALDDIYKGGELSEDVYVERRAELKKRLAIFHNSGQSS